MNDLNKLVIHSTQTPFGIEVDIEDIKEEHLDRGFDTIGFADVINFEGNIESTARLYDYKNGQRPYDWDVTNSRHIAYMGGVSEDGFNLEDTRTYEQKETLEIYIDFIKRRHPDVEIIDYTKTNMFTFPPSEELTQTL